jgi:hypothetical protein
MERQLTDLQYRLLDQLATTPEAAISPTDVGTVMRAWWTYSRITAESAWASPKLKLLEKRGLVAATEKRHYYLTKKGVEALIQRREVTGRESD